MKYTLEQLISDKELRKSLTEGIFTFSDEDGDLQAAKLATGVLKYVQERVGLQDAASKALVWSETCGCAFFKIEDCIAGADSGAQKGYACIMRHGK